MTTLRLCILVFLLVSLLACASATAPPTAIPAQDTQALATQIASSIFATLTASVPTAKYTLVATSTPTPTDAPGMLSCSIIESVRRDYRHKLTSEQYDLDGGYVDLYIKSLYGKRMNFRGVVDDVSVNLVFISDDSCQNSLSLSGIPHNESILLNKGTIISGYGTVGVFSTYQIIRVNVEGYQVVK